MYVVVDLHSHHARIAFKIFNYTMYGIEINLQIEKLKLYKIKRKKGERAEGEDNTNNTGKRDTCFVM